MSAAVTGTDPFGVGTVHHGGSRTITDAEIAFLPALMGASSPLFHDEETAKQTSMGGRILYGPALFGIVVALTEHLLRGRVLGLVEVRGLRFRRPVKPGDTVTGGFTVEEATPREGKPGILLRLADTATNQHGGTVLTAERLVLVSTYEPDGSP